MPKPPVRPVCHCGRLISAAIPLPVRPTSEFNTKTYCSQRCAALHLHGESLPHTRPLITCDVCAEDKPFAEYIHSIKDNGQWNIPIPPGCLHHIAVYNSDSSKSGVCIDCLTSHISIQFEIRGAIDIACIHSHTTPTGLTHDWLPYVNHFLPADLHDTFYQQLFNDYILTTNTTIWACPSGCGSSNGILQPLDTPGFPHVECPDCHVRFCANCKIPWHKGQTCQQYRATNPSVQDEGEVKLLREMAKLHARRCPRCQYMIVKDGGCDHVHCEQCHTDFYWPQAEVVVAPVETFVPAASATTFQGWARLREAQQNYIVQNNISDQPFNIGTTESPQQDEGLFFFNPDFNFFNPERCELDAIAARTAGKRLIRAPKHDHGGVWAFVEIGPEHFGGFELGAAIEEEQRQNHNIRLVAHPLFEDFADDIDIHWPFPELDEEEPDAEEGETIDIDFVLRQAIGTRHLDVAVGVRRLEALAMAGGFEQVVDDILHGRPITIDW